MEENERSVLIPFDSVVELLDYMGEEFYKKICFKDVSIDEYLIVLTLLDRINTEIQRLAEESNDGQDEDG